MNRKYAPLTLVMITTALTASSASALDYPEQEPEVTPVVAATADDIADLPSVIDRNAGLQEFAQTNANIDFQPGEEGEGDTMSMLSDVTFEFGHATLLPEAIATLEALSSELKDVERIEVKGHTDSIGPEDQNLALSERRAEAVRNWLLANSELAPEQVVPVGIGEAEPIANNASDDGADNPDGRALNRRVEFVVY